MSLGVYEIVSVDTKGKTLMFTEVKLNYLGGEAYETNGDLVYWLVYDVPHTAYTN